MIDNNNFDFSFSGLKTAVLYYLKKISQEEQNNCKSNIVASFQEALVEVLVEKTIKAAKHKNVNNIALAGGVACNSYLRKKFEIRTKKEGINLFIPSPILCTDNAAMIACNGLFKLNKGVSLLIELLHNGKWLDFNLFFIIWYFFSKILEHKFIFSCKISINLSSSLLK